MPRTRLEELLAELDQQIAGADSLDGDLKQRLEQLQTTIESRLGEAETQSGPGSLVEPVRQAIDEFEDSHPTLTLTLGRIMDVLNKLGI
ncbi:MAG: DUF4404 domain-containing protein [Chromatiales bacterium]|jgi:hypothetical protein|nr:MAG: DUF4404 domain-containing protein [Chromatiales bacterium]